MSTRSSPRSCAGWRNSPSSTGTRSSSATATATRNRELDYLRLLRGRRVDGIILAPTGGSHPALERLVATRYPLVLVDGAVPELDVDHVSVDNEAAAYAAVRHLTDPGHRSIAMVSGGAAFTSTEPRIIGYRRALADARSPVFSGLVVSVESRMREGRAAVLQLIARDPGPSALFVVNSHMTVGAMIALRELGVSMPDDLAYVGFYDLDWAAFLRPQLTMIAQPAEEIGPLGDVAAPRAHRPDRRRTCAPGPPRGRAEGARIVGFRGTRGRGARAAAGPVRSATALLRAIRPTVPCAEPLRAVPAATRRRRAPETRRQLAG